MAKSAVERQKTVSVAPTASTAASTQTIGANAMAMAIAKAAGHAARTEPLRPGPPMDSSTPEAASGSRMMPTAEPSRPPEIAPVAAGSSA